jgi:hypothetical protein
VEIRVDLEGWYWTPANELRACLVLDLAGERVVVDAETLEAVSVALEDVMIEKPP